MNEHRRIFRQYRFANIRDLKANQHLSEECIIDAALSAYETILEERSRKSLRPEETPPVCYEGYWPGQGYCCCEKCLLKGHGGK